jgi:aminoglycoside phosphotransferase (APT) family kinase protein
MESASKVSQAAMNRNRTDNAQRSGPPVPGVDFDRLELWMDGKGLGSRPIEDVRLISGGTQNIMVRFRRGARDFVLRRPPPPPPQ